MRLSLEREALLFLYLTTACARRKSSYITCSGVLIEALVRTLHARPVKIAIVSEHASPLAVAGGTDSGGQNIYVANVARQLARHGHKVDVFTRRESAEQPARVAFCPGVRVIH